MFVVLVCYQFCGAKLLLFFDICKFFAYYICIYANFVVPLQRLSIERRCYLMFNRKVLLWLVAT